MDSSEPLHPRVIDNLLLGRLLFGNPIGRRKGDVPMNRIMGETLIFKFFHHVFRHNNPRRVA